MNLETSTNSLTGKIESIIKEAKSDLYLVSPYIQLSKWDAIVKALKFSLSQGVKINFIVRRPLKKNGEIDQAEWDKLLVELKEFLDGGCKLYFVENLHAKLYHNKSECLIASMNLYFHSSEKNFELGVLILKKDADELEKLERYVQYLISAGDLYQTKQELKKEEQALDKITQDETSKVEFRVISKGYKWFKVENHEGYQNKVLIQDAPTLKVEERYTAKAKVNFSRTPYGFNVTYTQIHDIELIEGYCLNCKKIVEKKYLLCFQCNEQKKKGGKLILQYCHGCGQEKEGLSLEKPVCKPCFIKDKKS